MESDQPSVTEPLRDAEENVRTFLKRVQGPDFLPAIERRLQVVSDPRHEDWVAWEQVAEKLEDLSIAFAARAEEVREAIKAVRPSAGKA